MEKIAEIIWYDGARAGDYDPAYADRVFKWNLVEKGGRLFLMAMPHDAGLDFHPELLKKVCELKGWERGDVEALGGGVRFKNGEILHRSTHFGPMPEEYRNEALRLLGITPV